MQLSLHLLQVPTIELRDLIKQELEKNPTLEEVPPETISLDQPQSFDDQESHDGRNDTESEFKQEFEALKRLDDEWRDYFNQSIAPAPAVRRRMNGANSSSTPLCRRSRYSSTCSASSV